MTPAAEITERLAAIRERCAKATPGPWETEECHGQDTIWIDVCGPKEDEILHGEPLYIGQIESPQRAQIIADLEFAAHARDDIPWLLKQLELARDLAMQRSIMLDESRAKLAEAQKDSARLDWLIRHHESIGFASGDREPDSWIETSKLRSAIDKAMGAAK